MAAPTTPAQAQQDFPTPQSFGDYLDQHWPDQQITKPSLPGSNIGQQWLNWYASESKKHPGTSLGTFEITFFDLAVAASLAKGITAAVTGTATATAEAGQATAAGFSEFSGLAAIGDFFSRLTQASTWIRVAEVLLGAGLIIVAIAKLASDTPIGHAAAKAGKAAMIL